MAVIAWGVTAAASWAAVAFLAVIDYSSVIVALIAAIASVTNTLLIRTYRKGQRELKADTETVKENQQDIKDKLGANQRKTDKR